MPMKSLWILINFLFLTGYRTSEIRRNKAAVEVETAIAGTSENSLQTPSYKADSWVPREGRSFEAQNKVPHPYRDDVTYRKHAGSKRHPAIRVKRAVCGGDIRSSSGEITSPLHPREYQPNTNCTWKIIGSSTERIILVFTSFNLESEALCSYDHVVVYAERNGVLTRKHGPFCGTDTPPVIATEKSNMLINFKTDSSQERTGFRATFRKDVCGGDIRSSSGVITSPFHPRDYLPYTNCTWNIIGSPTERIVLVFTSFNIESGTNCKYDHVLVYTERNDAITRTHGPFCGTQKPPVITSEENNLLINFKTDHSDQRSGFSVTYRKEPCGGVFTATEGKITSPQFPQRYPPNKRCTYEIVAPRQHCINLMFTHFELENQGDCGYDSVQINSTTHSGTVHQYGRTCGSTAPTNITCEGKKLRIEFKSDNSYEYSGFAAYYNTVFAECASNNAGCKQICKSNAEGKHTCACRTGFVLHPDEHDCKEENTAERIVHFSSLAHPNGSLIFSWRWRGGAVPSELSGFYFKATSPDHTVQITLPPTSTNFSADQLRVYKEYDITFWPFYKPAGASDEKLGRPTTLTVHTPASAPTAPGAVTPWPKSAWLGPAELTLTIYGPLAWNSMPGGYRLRWETTDAEYRNESIINFPESSANAERRKYDLNVTLSLKPGHRYIVFASAFGLGDMGETLIGPETSTEFRTIPLAPVNLRAKIVDPTSAMLAWESASPATRYEITVHLQNISEAASSGATASPPTFHSLDGALNNRSEIAPSNHQVSSSMVLWTRSRENHKATIWLDGNHLTSSNYSLPVFGLMPYRNYEVQIRSCKSDACSEKTSKIFRTSPSSIPKAIITRIFSNDTSSIHIEWSLPQPEEWVDLGLQFEVRVYNDGVFREITTTEMALTIINLSSGAKYEIEMRPSLEVVPGTRRYGKPATAVVSTWPLVPLPPTLSTEGFENAADVVAVSWVFFNSTVLHVEVATNRSDFVNCTALSACDVVVLYGWTSSFKAGFIKISGLNPHEAHIIHLRGCNDNGCGDPTTVNITTGFSEPSEPVGLHLSAEVNEAPLLAWEPPLEPGGPLTGYLVSWKCANNSAMAATTTECYLVVPGLPTHPQECSFTVSAYHVGDDGEELRGKPATLTTLWPYDWTSTADPVAA